MPYILPPHPEVKIVDKGFLLAIYSVISGWILILMSLFLIKVLITTLGTKGLFIALTEVVVGFLALGGALYLWYLTLRALFLRVKSTPRKGNGGPGGT